MSQIGSSRLPAFVTKGSRMLETTPNFRLRAVITEADTDYIVSVSRVSRDNDIAIVGEEEVATIETAHDFIGQIARQESYAPENVEKIYNIAGKISNKAPKGRK
jgi:hypothetical protein